MKIITKNFNKPIAVQIEDAWIQYNDTPLLQNINLTIHEKEIVAIVGPNGSGKTTLLKAIMGFKGLTKGAITVFNNKPKALQRKGWIGYLPQVSGYDTRYPIKVKDVVSLTRLTRKKIWNKLSNQDQKIIFDSLKKVNMDSFAEHHFGSLSGGQKQRVLIARALALKPRMLILDEPSTGLDSVAQDSFYKLLQNIRNEENLTILMVSHDIGTVSTIVDTIACIKGTLHFHGPPEHCRPDDELAKIFGKNVYFLQHDKNCESCIK